jgi:Baseplate J-like protein
MSLTPPNLDDRTFEQLLKACRDRIPELCKSWTDLSEGDPGIVLLELFAYLTETMIYRLNRLPEKAFVEFLNLLGVTQAPPQAAIVTLRFSVEKPPSRAIEIPRGTRAAVGRMPGGAEPIVFVTDRTVAIAAGETAVDVTAHHCEDITAELLGTGTGEPGLTVRVSRPPIIAPTRDGLDLVVGVEAIGNELDERTASVRFGDMRFRVWREVSSFAEAGADPHAFVVDRASGTIQFAPGARMRDADGTLTPAARALAAVPASGREIRAWYRRGGGGAGNAKAGVIDTLKDPIPQVRVTNPADAAGGRDAETLENALVRGPQEIRSRDRAVTADDFESQATRFGGIARARAITRAQYWRYATPGTVEVLLVPAVPGHTAPGFRVTLDRLTAAQSEPLRADIEARMRERRALGTECLVSWARYKRVVVSARVVLYEQENVQNVRERLLERLHRAFSPLPNAVRPGGWSFGDTLRAFHVHDSAFAEPGVKFVDRVRFRVDEMPDRDVTVIRVDPFQPGTWYAGSGQILYRTVNNGEGWEPAGRFDGQVVEHAAHPSRPGLLAVASRAAGDTVDVRVSISRDCGETWEERARVDYAVRSLAWIDRDGEPLLLMATDAGLFQLTAAAGRGPAQIDLASDHADLPPPVAVAAAVNLEGQVCVAVALSQRRGVWLSRDAARNDTFRSIGVDSSDVRVLRTQEEGSRSFLWAGTFSGGGDEGTGCFRYELTGSEAPPEGWMHFDKSWSGGSCYALAFAQGQAYAATHHGGVLRLDSRSASSAWRGVRLTSGLPLNRDAEPAAAPGEREGLARVVAVAADPVTGRVLAGGPLGIFRSDDRGEVYVPVSIRESDQVTLPPTWLFVPGEHELTVVHQHELD